MLKSILTATLNNHSEITVREENEHLLKTISKLLNTL